MSRIHVLFASCVLACGVATAQEENKYQKLRMDTSTLSGKLLGVTRHEPPTFEAVTLARSLRGLSGQRSIENGGRVLMLNNRLSDPAEVLERELVPAVAKHFGLELVPGVAPILQTSLTKDVLAPHPRADYVLDIETTGWKFSYQKNNPGRYWFAYSARVSLLDAKTRKVLSRSSCYTDTKKHPDPPYAREIHADNAQVVKDVTASLGWRCVWRFATMGFGLSPAELRPVPNELNDPLTVRKKLAPGDAPDEEPEPGPEAKPAAN